MCAGRTDALVHATSQVIHFDTIVIRSIKHWISGSNAHLPLDIRVIWAKFIPKHFHARFSAISRTYRYIIYNNNISPPHLLNLVKFVNVSLNYINIKIAANILVGTHDFTSFRSKQCSSKSSIKTIYYINVIKNYRFIIFDICGNSFLHHMVRNIIGVLINIGSGKRSIQWIHEVLKAKNRQAAAETASAYGLYLVRVQYPEIFRLPKNKKLGPSFIIE